MKTTFPIRLFDGTIVPANTNIHFSAEGFGYYQGKKLKKVGASVELDVSFPPKPAMELNDTDVLTMTIDWNLDESIIG